MGKKQKDPVFNEPQSHSALLSGSSPLQSPQENQASAFFSGVFNRTIDERGRIFLTREFREALGDSCYLNLSNSKDYVQIYPVSTWRKICQEYFPDFSPFEGDEKKRAREFGASSSFENIDKNGRILIPQHMLATLEIEPEEGTELLLVGSIYSIEVWTKKRYQRKNQIFIPESRDE
ncbi:MAG: hypothetical protein V2A78_13545 [bacterium]